MDNDLRERIMDLLVTNPGSYLGKMGRDLRVPTSTLKYHLNILRSFDLVTTVKKGRCRHYFLRRRRFTDHEKRMFAALEHAPTRRMVDLVRTTPGVSQAGLVQMTGLSQSTVAWHMGKLEEMGLVMSERRGVKEYFLAPDFKQVLDAMMSGDQGDPNDRSADLSVPRAQPYDLVPDEPVVPEPILDPRSEPFRIDIPGSPELTEP